MITRFHTEPSALPPRTFVNGKEPVPSARRVNGDTDHEIGIGKGVVFWEETSVGDAPGDDEGFVDWRDWLRGLMLLLCVFVGGMEEH